MTDVKKKSCYVISPIDKPESLVRQHADNVFDFVIVPAMEKCMYAKPERSDREPIPGIVTTSIINHLCDDDLVIAVLTFNNPNVLYELAIRHAVMKPCIHLRDINSPPPPFDISGMHMILYDSSSWASPSKTIDEILKAVKITENQKTIVNPISSARAIKESILSENKDAKNLALIVEQLQQVTYNLQNQSFSPSISPSMNEVKIGEYDPRGSGLPGIHYAPLSNAGKGDIGPISLGKGDLEIAGSLSSSIKAADPEKEKKR